MKSLLPFVTPVARGLLILFLLACVTPSLAQGQTTSYVSFTKLGSYPTDSTAAPLSAPALGDFNGDGFPDLAVITQNNTTGNGNVVNVMLNDRTGALSLMNTYPLAETETIVQAVTGDFNGDGKVDLILLGHTYTTAGSFLTVLLGNGDGSLQAPVVYTFGSTFSGLVTGDFNKDHKLDLATTDSNGMLALFLGNGDGTFSPPTEFGVGVGSAGGLEVADFNGDGNLDLAGLGVVLGNGDGTFQPPISPEVTPGFVGDFNGDGKPDILGYLGNGDGTFTPVANLYSVETNPVVLGLADVDSHGTSDLIGDETLNGNLFYRFTGVYLSNGDGTFGLRITIISYGDLDLFPSFELSADMNGDGRPDLLFGFGETGTYVEVYLNETGATPGTKIIPSSIPTFPPQAVATVSGSVPVTMTNTGTVPLTITGVLFESTNANQFILTGNNCPAALAPAATCTVSVAFAPTVAGVDTAYLTFLDNAGTGTQFVPLLGSTSTANFSIASSALNTVKPGGSVNSAVTLSVLPGFSGTVALACPGLSNGIACSFAPATLTTSQPESVVTVSTLSSTPSGTYPITVTGTLGSVVVSNTLSLVVDSPSFTIGPQPGSATSVTLSAGQSTVFSLVATPTGYANTINLSCAVAPTATGEPTCTLPGSVNLSSGSQNIGVTVATASGSSAAMRFPSLPPGTMLVTWTMFLFGSGFLRLHRRRRLALATSIVLAVVLGMAGCGGGSSPSSSTTGSGGTGSGGGSGSGGSSGSTRTPAGTYTVTVTATEGSVSASTVLTLIVQ